MVKFINRNHKKFLSGYSLFGQGLIIPELVFKMLHTQLGVQTAAGNTPSIIRGAQKHRNISKGEAPREPPPCLNKLGSRTPLQRHNCSSFLADSECSNLVLSPVRVVWRIFPKSWISLDRGSLRKFKELLHRIKAQPDSMSKIFGLSLVEVFDG